MNVQLKPSLIHGTGVFATATIRPGAVILEIDDSRVVDDQHPLREEMGENPDHRDWLPDGSAVLMQQPERYINHSCEPNAFVYSVRRKRFVVALRNIAAGQEITYDYAMNAVNGAVWTCCCGGATCRGRHNFAFFSLPQARQLEFLPFLDPWFVRVHEDRILDLLKSSGEPPPAGDP